MGSRYVPGFESAYRRGRLRRLTLGLLAGLSLAVFAIDLVLSQGFGAWIALRHATGPDLAPAGIAAVSPSMKSTGTLLHDRLAAAGTMLAAGNLHGAQHEYLTILLSMAPDSAQAWRGLAALHRRRAAESPAELRRQANAYRLMIRNGMEMDEHYSPRALEVLAKATVLAAREVEDTSRETGASRTMRSQDAGIERFSRAAAASVQTRWRPIAAYVIRVGEFANPTVADRLMHFIRSKGYIVTVARRGAVSQVVTPPYRIRRQAEYVVHGLEGLGLPADLLARELPSQ